MLVTTIAHANASFELVVAREVAHSKGWRYSIGNGLALPILPIDGNLGVYWIGGRTDWNVHVAEGAYDPAVRLCACHLMGADFGISYQLDLEHLEVNIFAALADVL